MNFIKRLEQMRSVQEPVPAEKVDQPSQVEEKPSQVTNWVAQDPCDPKTKKYPCKVIVTGKVIKIIQTDTNKKMILTPSPGDVDNQRVDPTR